MSYIVNSNTTISNNIEHKYARSNLASRIFSNRKMKKALLFAAGMGTRLKPLTDVMPKALVPIDGKPLLEITLNRLIHHGFNEIVINVHHYAEQIINYVNSHNFPANIYISDESEQLLETGGGLKKALDLFTKDDSPILLHNVDILSNANLHDFYESSRDKIAHLMVSKRHTNRLLLFDNANHLKGWQNITSGEIRSPYPNLDITVLHPWAFSGIHCVSPDIHFFMKECPQKFSIIDFYLSICNKVDIDCYIDADLKLLDVGKQDTLKIAEDFLTKY